MTTRKDKHVHKQMAPTTSPKIPAKQMIKYVWNKQWRFLVGTVIIALTWCAQNFLIDKYKDKIEGYRRDLTMFYKYQNDCGNDAFRIRTFQLQKKQFEDTIHYDTTMFDLATQQGSDLAGISYYLDNFKTEYNNPTSYLDRYKDELQIVFNAIQNPKQNYGNLVTFIHQKEYEVQTTNFDSQLTVLTMSAELLVKIDNVHFWSTLFFIIGTFLIAYNRSLEYLRKVDIKQ